MDRDFTYCRSCYASATFSTLRVVRLVDGIIRQAYHKCQTLLRHKATEVQKLVAVLTQDRGDGDFARILMTLGCELGGVGSEVTYISQGFLEG
jgi:hypothetical protein